MQILQFVLKWPLNGRGLGCRIGLGKGDCSICVKLENKRFIIDRRTERNKVEPN